MESIAIQNNINLKETLMKHSHRYQTVSLLFSLEALSSKLFSSIASNTSEQKKTELKVELKKNRFPIPTVSSFNILDVNKLFQQNVIIVDFRMTGANFHLK